MEFGFAIGFFASIITATVVYVVIKKAMGGKCLKGTEFDERQEQARGRAYKYGFFTLLFAILGLMILFEFKISLPVSNTLALFAAAMISIDVNAVYSIMNDAYFGLETKRRAYLALIVLVVAANIAGAVFSLGEVDFAAKEIIDLSHGANMCVAIGFIPILIALAAAQMSERRDDDEES